MKDSKNEDTVWVIRDIKKNKMNIVLKLSTKNDGYKNSIITGYKVSKKQFERYVRKNEIIFDKTKKTR